MTPDQIIEEVWKLPWHQAVKVALQDDIVLLVKLWPLWLVLCFTAFGLIAFALKKGD